MNNETSTGTSTWKAVSGRAPWLLAGLLGLVVAVLALTFYVTTTRPTTLASESDPVAAAIIQPQAAQADILQHNAALAAEEPMSADLEAQDNVTPSASCLERLFLHQQLEQDMCEGACGR